MRVVSHAHNELKAADPANADVLRFKNNGCGNGVFPWPYECFPKWTFKLYFVAACPVRDTLNWLRFHSEPAAVVELSWAPG